MSEDGVERRLTTILAADIVGYGRLMAADEAGTQAQFKAHRKEFFEPRTGAHHWRVFKVMGDGILMEFGSVVDAVNFAVDFQRTMADRNVDVPEDRQVIYRIGINIGDVIVEGDDINGNGVIVASRLEALAEPGGIYLSRTVFDHVKGKVEVGFEDLGAQKVKNIPEPLQTFKVLLESRTTEHVTVAAPAAKGTLRWPLVAGSLILLMIVSGALLWQRPWAPREQPASVAAMAFPLPAKPSIAVLAFDDLSQGGDQGYLSDAISEEIITKLSHFSEFFVIARNSSFFYKGKVVDVREIGRELGVRYVLEGSMQRAGDRLRVSVQLIDAVAGNHIWAATYDRDLVDVFAVQDEITRTIVATLEQSIDLAEYNRLLRQPTESLGAYELVMRGRTEWLKFTPEGNEESKRLAEKALELDPNYSEAYIRLFYAHTNCFSWGWCDTRSREESLGLALEMARKAVELDPFSHRAHWVLANATMQSGDLDQAVAEYDRAIELNPNSAGLLAHSVEVLVYLGRAEEAVSRTKAAIRLNPRHPDWYLWNLGWAQYSAELYDDALASLRKMNKMPNGARRTLAPVLVRLGRLEEAQAVIAEFRKNEPGYSLEDANNAPFEHKEYLERWIEDLRIAGLPE